MDGFINASIADITPCLNEFPRKSPASLDDFLFSIPASHISGELVMTVAPSPCIVIGCNPLWNSLSLSFSPDVCISNKVRNKVIPMTNCCTVNTKGGMLCVDSNIFDDAMGITPRKYQSRTATVICTLPVSLLDLDETLPRLAQLFADAT